MSNFTFWQAEFPPLYEAATQAEGLAQRMNDFISEKAALCSR